MDTHRSFAPPMTWGPLGSLFQQTANVLERISSSVLGRYGLALGTFAVLIGVSAGLSYLGIKISLTILIILGLVITGWYGGIGPGILMAVLIVLATALSQPIAPDVSTARYIFGHFSNFALIVFIVALIHSRKIAELRLRTKRLALEQMNETLERRVAERTSQLELANRELESFSYSVSHDLRAPLRSIDSFSYMLLEDYDHLLDAEGKSYLKNVRGSASQMSHLIDDMLQLATVTKGKVNRSEISLSNMAREILSELHQREPEREVEYDIEDGVTASADERLIRIALQNLIQNAWKFTAKTPRAKIEFGKNANTDGVEYFVRDNGAGFDMEYSAKLFGAFERLHGQDEFDGTGVGLATVRRVIDKHGGAIRGEGITGKGAGFYFTL